MARDRLLAEVWSWPETSSGPAASRAADSHVKSLRGKLGKGLLGAAFIVIGVAIVSGADKRVEAALVDASPAWLTELTTSF